MSHIHRITDYLYVGTAFSSRCHEVLYNHGITSSLNVDPAVSNNAVKEVRDYRLPLYDPPHMFEYYMAASLIIDLLNFSVDERMLIYGNLDENNLPAEVACVVLAFIEDASLKEAVCVVNEKTSLVDKIKFDSHYITNALRLLREEKCFVELS